jgi:hypothetical protein
MSKSPFEVEMELNMRIYFAADGWFKKSEVLQGKIRWVRPINQSYAMGIEFLEPIGANQPDLLAYIESGGYHGYCWKHDPAPLLKENPGRRL